MSDDDYYRRQQKRGEDGIYLLISLAVLLLTGLGMYVVLYAVFRGLEMLAALFV